MNDYESYLMWKVYGDRGCAIQTNYERLVASFGKMLIELLPQTQQIEAF